MAQDDSPSANPGDSNAPNAEQSAVSESTPVAAQSSDGTQAASAAASAANGDPAATGAAQRQPTGASAAAAMKHMRASAKDAIRRTEDFTSEIMLPISCILLIIAIWVPGIPQVKAAIFLLPLFAFLYYLRARIGIACTFNKRQAYLTWHILIATFLLGGTASLFGVYVVAYLTRIALGIQSS